MKTNITGRAMLAVLLSVCASLSGCHNAGYSVITHRVYFADAATSTAKTIAIDNQPVTAAVVLRLDQPIPSGDVVSTIGIDESLIDQYNKINQTEVKLLPAEYYSFDPNVAITAGEVSSSPMQISITPFPSNDRYAIPLRITSTEGPASPAGASSSFLLLVDKPRTFNCPTLKPISNSASMVRCAPFLADGVTPTADWNIVTSEWTLEFWVKMSNFTINNQALFNCGGVGTANEIYVRFGDAGSPYNWLQVKTQGTQADTPKTFNPNTWYHIALVYDGAKLTVYRNGVVDASKATPGGTITINRMDMIASGATYFTADCNLSEIRYWKKARSVTQIINNRFYQIDPSNPDLILYFRMDEGSGTTFHDLTGNGHDAKALNGVLKNWQTGQRFN